MSRIGRSDATRRREPCSLLSGGATGAKHSWVGIYRWLIRRKRRLHDGRRRGAVLGCPHCRTKMWSSCVMKCWRSSRPVMTTLSDEDVEQLRQRFSKKGPLWDLWEYGVRAGKILIYSPVIPWNPKTGKPDPALRYRVPHLRIVPSQPGPFGLQYWRHTERWVRGPSRKSPMRLRPTPSAFALRCSLSREGPKG